jgi:hypothetical protein
MAAEPCTHGNHNPLLGAHDDERKGVGQPCYSFPFLTDYMPSRTLGAIVCATVG